MRDDDREEKRLGRNRWRLGERAGGVVSEKTWGERSGSGEKDWEKSLAEWGF
jgi:hypothetical protein